jgi:hypothetical protein
MEEKCETYSKAFFRFFTFVRSAFIPQTENML